ncbi:MAG: SLC13 family permease [Rhodospirillales bacterium]|nr:SLC13 family permease [Rhodospirillales bacterium]
MSEYVFLGILLLAALYLFWSQRLRPDVTAFLVMLALIVPWPHPGGEWRGVLTYEQGFSGFGSAAVLMIASMFIMGSAMVQTGAAEVLGLGALRRVAGREWSLQMAVLTLATVMSMFINDTTVVVILLPLLLNLCREFNLPPSRYLLLAAYGALMGGQWTLIGTRSNILLSDFLRQRTDAGIGFFDFTPNAAAVFLVAAAFVFFIGRHWLPAHEPEQGPEAVTRFLTEIVVAEGSSAVGRKIRELDLFRNRQLRIVAVIRDGRRQVRSAPLAAGDMILIRGTADQIGRFVKSSDFEVQEQTKLTRAFLAKVDLVTVEAMVSPSSYFVGATLEDIALSDRYGVTVLGMERRGHWLTERLTETRLMHGDALLLLGSADDVERLGRSRDLILLQEHAFPAVGQAKALILLGLMAGVIVLSVGGLMAAAISIPLAAALAILFGCISVRSAYAAIDWPTLVILGGMIPFGIALEESGAASAIATLAVQHPSASGATPIVFLAALLLAAVVLTQMIENAAVAIIVAPIAFQVAELADLDAKAVMIPLAVCISAGFATPVAHEATILVMGPGEYRFKHYLLLGGVLAIITWLVTLIVTPLVWPLAG